MLLPSRSTLATFALLLLITVAGVAVRLAPWWSDPGGMFIGDAAFHFRIAQQAVATGRVPAVDSLALAPRGRVLTEFLPDDFYRRAAGFHRLASALGWRDLRVNVLVAVAIAGGLIALPAFGAAWAVFRDGRAALLSALIAAAMPAHVHRTWCYWFRYEALGSLFLTAHVAFGLGALAARGRRTSLALAAGSAVSLAAALAQWRVAFMPPLLETGFVLAWALLRPPTRALREWFTAVALGGSLACVFIPYLRAQAFGLSPAWLITVATAIVLWTPWLVREKSRAWARGLTLIAAVTVAILVAGLFSRERQYVPVLLAFQRKVSSALGITLLPPAPMEALALALEELAGATPAELLGPAGFSWLGVVFAAAPILYWWHAGRPGFHRLREISPASALLGYLCVAFTIITLLFVRNKILLAPLAAAVIGGLVTLLLPARPRSEPAGAARGKPTSARHAPAPGRLASMTVLAVLALATVVTAYDGALLAATRRSRLDPGLAAALDYLGRNTPERESILSTWERGYEIQYYAQRRTLVDGLLEDPEDQRRVVEMAGAMLQRSPGPLAELCEKYGVVHLLVPPSTYLLALVSAAPAAMRLELADLARKLQISQPLTPVEADRVIIHMMVLGESPAPFEKVFEQDDWRVYRVRRPGSSPP